LRLALMRAFTVFAKKIKEKKENVRNY